jgi:hypothetical protein
MFDVNRLHPSRIAAAFIRRIREIPHSMAWKFSGRGRKNRDATLSYKDKHRGDTLYLLANGPSINKVNLNKLKGSYVMCMNRFYIKFEAMGFKPNYLVCIEETVLDQFYQDFSQLDIPIFVNWRSRSAIPNAVYLKESFDINLFFQPDLTKPANAGGTVTYVCLQLAFYMGFQKVIIVGMDHSFKETGVSAKAEIRKYDKDESHFDPNYFPKGMKWLLPDLIKSEYAYSIANEYYKEHGREIVDATIGGKCTVFNKVDFRELEV